MFQRSPRYFALVVNRRDTQSVTADEVKKALELKAVFSTMLGQMQRHARQPFGRMVVWETSPALPTVPAR